MRQRPEAILETWVSRTRACELIPLRSCDILAAEYETVFLHAYFQMKTNYLKGQDLLRVMNIFIFVFNHDIKFFYNNKPAVQTKNTSFYNRGKWNITKYVFRVKICIGIECYQLVMLSPRNRINGSTTFEEFWPPPKNFPPVLSSYSSRANSCDKNLYTIHSIQSSLLHP